MLSSSPSKITNHSSPACPRDQPTGDSTRKLRNTTDPVGFQNAASGSEQWRSVAASGQA